MSVLQYQGKTYDAAAFQDVPEEGRTAQLVQDLVTPSQSGTIVTGIQKVLQRAVIDLLTPRGSKLLAKDSGTDFMTRLRRGQLRSELDVFTAFNFAASKIIREQRAERKEDDPADEQLKQLILDKIAIDGQSVSMTISIVTEAGESRQFIVPIEVLP